MPGLGEAFRAAREARNLSLSDVADQIHIRAVYLQAIEEEDWSAIVAPVYVRGFIRTYARFLGLDPQLAIEEFNASAGDAAAVSAPVSVRPVRRRPSPWLWIGAATAAILVGLVAFNYLTLQRSSEPAAQVAALPSGDAVSPAAAPSAAASPGVSAAPTESPLPTPKPAALSVRLVERSWLRIVVDGENKEEGIFERGTHWQFNGKVAVVRAGNAAGVDVTVNGKHQGPLGPAGDVVERTYLLAKR